MFGEDEIKKILDLAIYQRDNEEGKYGSEWDRGFEAGMRSAGREMVRLITEISNEED